MARHLTKEERDRIAQLHITSSVFSKADCPSGGTRSRDDQPRVGGGIVSGVNTSPLMPRRWLNGDDGSDRGSGSWTIRN